MEKGGWLCEQIPQSHCYKLFGVGFVLGAVCCFHCFGFCLRLDPSVCLWLG